MKLELLIYSMSCNIEVVQYVSITFIKNTCVNDGKAYRETKILKYIIGNANDEPTNFRNIVDQFFFGLLHLCE